MITHPAKNQDNKKNVCCVGGALGKNLKKWGKKYKAFP